MSDYYQQPMFCYNHPKRETLLRCNQCDRPICTSCAVRTPTGYRCRECVRGQQKIFDTAQWWDYPVAALSAAVLAYFGSILARLAGFFVLLLAPVVGIIIAEAVRRILKKRRSRWLPLVAAIAVFVGSVIPLVSSIILIIIYSAQPGMVQGAFPGLLSFIWPLAFAAIAASTVYYRLKGIRV
jgi:uncharacterized paraquat-inducible protein A